MINVIGFALYGSLAASHRVRLAQYREGLVSEGINLEIQSLLVNEYLGSRFGHESMPLWPLLRAGAERFFLTLSKRRFDVAIVQCELFPLLPTWFEQLVFRLPYMYDFDDAWYLRYRVGRLAGLGPLLGRKCDSAIRRASSVLAGSNYLSDYARKFSENVTILPSVVDTARFVPRAAQCFNPVFTVGWIGSPTTAPYLQALIEPLRIFGREANVRLLVIGGKAPRIEGIDVLEVPWSEEVEIELIQSFDVGVMPIPDDEWARGKCAYKLVQYMACGVPVVASRVGANIDLVLDNCGFLVSTSQQWVDAFRRLYREPIMRHQMGDSCRKRVLAGYSLEGNLPLLSKAISMAVGS